MSSSTESHSSQHKRPAWRRFVRYVVGALVFAGLSYKVWQERSRLGDQSIEFDVTDFLIAGVCYVTGLTTCAFYWYIAMRDCGSQPRRLSTLAAYFVGHLAKYVPGKGLVLVVRSGMIQGRVHTATAAMTSFQESILMMATGALVAAVLSIVEPVQLPGYPSWFVPLMSIAVACGLGGLAAPPISGWLGRVASRPFRSVDSTAVVSSGWSVMIVGSLSIAVGWFFLGLSFAYVLEGLGQPDAITGRTTLLTMIIALATVGGFVSGLPGGLGLRELILVEVLEPFLVGMSAITAAVMLRLVWIAAEVVSAGLYTGLVKIVPHPAEPVD